MKNEILESELTTIKGSRSYRLIVTAKTMRDKINKDPLLTAKKLAKTAVKNPKRLVRLAKGTEHNTPVAELIENKSADYQTWISLYEPNADELEQQRIHSAKFTYRPLISILTPVFNPPEDVFRELVESVLEQTYGNFELCLGNFGDNEDIKRVLKEYEAKDSRIKVYTFNENKGIAGNSNLILKKVTGEYTALLDHDDTLSPDALYENVLKLNEQKYDFLFSDKDKIDEQGVRHEPFFKPKLSPETMLNANYLTHLDVMRTELVRQVGGWNETTDGAQDWDLFLKLMRATDKIAHIPKILYHWRVLATSTASSIETKPYALESQRRAAQYHLEALGLKATPYHDHTELLLHWDESVVPTPTFVIQFHTAESTRQLISQITKHFSQPHIYLLTEEAQVAQAEQVKSGDIIAYKRGKLAVSLAKLQGNLVANGADDDTVLFMDDRLILTGHFNFTDFLGWLSIPEVGGIGGKLLDKHTRLVSDVGGVLTMHGLKPLFHNYPQYYHGNMGNVEWIRNFNVVTRSLFGTKIAALKKVAFNKKLSDDTVLTGYMVALSHSYRLVYNSKAIVYTAFDPYENWNQDDIKGLIIDKLDSKIDEYSNTNLLSENPMLFATDVAQEDDTVDRYHRDALALVEMYDIDHATLERIKAESAHPKALTSAKTAAWFVPSFNSIYAGLNNIFSFAEYLAVEHGIKTDFYVLKAGDAHLERRLVTRKYPGLKEATFRIIDIAGAKQLPHYDLGICTLWSSAFTLAHCPSVGRRCYFIQDNEPNFYPQGSISALVDLSYRFGFFALANTDGLLDMYERNYNGKGCVVKSIVDLSKYHPEVAPKPKGDAPYNVFFYARPNMPRNAFELGLAGLRKLKEAMGDDVRIVTAGSDWPLNDYGMEGIIENLGLIPYDEVPEFYRSMDAGLMFMFSGHPGVVASELMASGCPVVVNDYNDVTWRELYQDEKTCLITQASASEVAYNLERTLTDKKLRETLIKGGLQKVKTFYTGYEASRDDAYEIIVKGK